MLSRRKATGVSLSLVSFWFLCTTENNWGQAKENALILRFLILAFIGMPASVDVV